jgi:DNA-binding NarL/FixJ family response regulator
MSSRIIAESSDGREAVRAVQSLQPDIAVIDISMPILNGLDAAREIGRSSAKTKTILLTQHDEDEYISEALETGIKVYVLKNQAASDLIQAISKSRAGRSIAAPAFSALSLRHIDPDPRNATDLLTPRERQVLQLIAEGKSTKDAASLLGISVKTAESHRTKLMHKLDIHEAASLVRYAVRHRIVRA